MCNKKGVYSTTHYPQVFTGERVQVQRCQRDKPVESFGVRVPANGIKNDSNLNGQQNYPKNGKKKFGERRM